MPSMSRAGLIFLGMAVIGVLILATGLGEMGPCADEGGAVAVLLVLLGAMGEAVLLLILVARAGWRRLKQGRAHAH